MNAVAGGGSFVAFPALLFTGVAPVPANATNTLSLWVGTAVSGGAYRNRLNIPRRILLPLLITSLVGGLLGAVLLIKTPARTFLRIIPWLIFGATLLFTFGRHLTGRISAGISHEASNAAVAGALGTPVRQGRPTATVLLSIWNLWRIGHCTPQSLFIVRLRGSTMMEFPRI